MQDPYNTEEKVIFLLTSYGEVLWNILLIKKNVISAIILMC